MKIESRLAYHAIQSWSEYSRVHEMLILNTDQGSALCFAMHSGKALTVHVQHDELQKMIAGFKQFLSDTGRMLDYGSRPNGVVRIEREGESEAITIGYTNLGEPFREGFEICVYQGENELGSISFGLESARELIEHMSNHSQTTTS